MSMTRDTSAKPTGLRWAVPLKMTSSILEPRRLLVDCSPSTQRMASLILDLAAAVGPHDGGHPLSEREDRLVRERLEAMYFQGL